MRKTVISMFKKKKPVEEIIEITGFCKRTVRQTISDYKRGGMAALKPKDARKKSRRKAHPYGGSGKRTCKNHYRQESRPVEDEVLSVDAGCSTPADQGKVRDRYAYSLVGMYLQRWGFTVQRPAKQAIEQKPEAVQRWLKEEYPAIHSEAKKEEAEIFWGDETAVQNVANYARGYAPKEPYSCVETESQKMHINMISAISNQGSCTSCSARTASTSRS